MSQKRKMKSPIMIGFVAVIVILLSGFGILNVSANPIQQNFTDVHNDFWAKDEVTQLVDLRLLTVIRTSSSDQHWKCHVDRQPI